MATIQHTTNATQTSVAFVANWAALGANDDGAPVMGAQYTDKNVQVTGDFGGASLVFEGSNNGTDYAALTDPQGNNLSFSAPKIEMVSEATLYIRPRVNGGDGSTDLSVSVLMKE